MGNILNETGGFLPPHLGAAIYRAATTIPTVTLDRDAVDAAGRHGIGVRIQLGPHGNRTMPQRRGVVFDPDTYTFVGRGAYSLGRSGAKKGAWNSAVLETGVVDRVGQLPH